jgi:hypothetical protein
MNGRICQNGAERAYGGGSEMNGVKLLPWSFIEYGYPYLILGGRGP